MESTFCGSVPTGTQLIETFALGPKAAARPDLHLDLHMARMGRSAKVLGFRFEEDKARALIAHTAPPADTPLSAPLRARLTLSQDGTLELTTAPLPHSKPVWTFAIHPTRLSSANLWLPHKSTQRALYNAARATLPEGIDEWVFLNERGEICEGTITNISITSPQGDHLTPPVSSGCLPGVYRQSLLDRGVLHEAVLTAADLQAATRITFMNALRGEILAKPARQP